MFTGLVTHVGRISSIQAMDDVIRFRVESELPIDRIEMGASIMHAGVCLTVVDFGVKNEKTWHDVEAIPETLARTVLGDWGEGHMVNLEQSLRMGDELGGHYVFGHVDCVADVASVVEEGGSYRIRINVPGHMSKYLAEKGSIAVNGVSLTVAAVSKNEGQDWFEVAIIPHTWSHTTLNTAQSGGKVNLEADMLARYVARMLGKEDG